MDSEQDLVVFTDDNGNEMTMEVLDYFFYEGQEYAVLTEWKETEEACDCEEDTECGCCEHDHEHGEMEAYIMRVVPVGDDQEEFVPVEDELVERLIEFVENDLYADEDDEIEEIEDDESEGD